MEANVKKKEKMHIICKTTKKAHTKKPTKKVKKKNNKANLQMKFTKKTKAGKKRQKCTKNALKTQSKYQKCPRKHHDEKKCAIIHKRIPYCRRNVLRINKNPHETAKKPSNNTQKPKMTPKLTKNVNKTRLRFKNHGIKPAQKSLPQTQRKHAKTK